MWQIVIDKDNKVSCIYYCYCYIVQLVVIEFALFSPTENWDWSNTSDKGQIRLYSKQTKKMDYLSKRNIGLSKLLFYFESFFVSWVRELNAVSQSDCAICEKHWFVRNTGSDCAISEKHWFRLCNLWKTLVQIVQFVRNTGSDCAICEKHWLINSADTVLRVW